MASLILVPIDFPIGYRSLVFCSKTLHDQNIQSDFYFNDQTLALRTFSIDSSFRKTEPERRESAKYCLT